MLIYLLNFIILMNYLLFIYKYISLFILIFLIKSFLFPILI